MYNYTFPTDYPSIIKRLNRIDVVKYGQTRNFVFGRVSYLSPYISRGVITLPFIKKFILDKFSKEDAIKFIYELAWREYYQRTWNLINNKIFDDVKHPQEDVLNYEMPESVLKHTTGILTIDEQIKTMYKTGYLHNHTRMYVATIVCNHGKSHWLIPSKWMYYYLLDGDLGSNALSWQWISGSFSSKKYYANQDNLNYYTNSIQKQTFLDVSYDELPQMPQPESLIYSVIPDLKTEIQYFRDKFPTSKLQLNTELPLLIYNSYNLDPLWHSDEQANRLLLIEPSHFEKHPIAKNVMFFILDLSKNINGIQVFVGEFDEIPGINEFNKIIYKQHPVANHYKGEAEKQEWLFPEVHEKFYNSFSGFWNICEKFYFDKTLVPTPK